MKIVSALIAVCVVLGAPALAVAGDLRAAQADLSPAAEPGFDVPARPQRGPPTLHLPAPAPLRSPVITEFPGVTAIPDKPGDPRVLALPLDQAAGLGVRVAADSGAVVAPHQRSDDDLSLIGLIELRQPLN